MAPVLAEESSVRPKAGQYWPPVHGRQAPVSVVRKKLEAKEESPYLPGGHRSGRIVPEAQYWPAVHCLLAGVLTLLAVSAKQ